MNAQPARYVICFYRQGVLVHEIAKTTRDGAELAAMDGLRESGVEVTIYDNGRALRGWNRRMA